jgi:hypothetical protein
VLVALTLSFRSEMTLTDLRGAIREITVALQQADGRIAYVYVRPAPDVEPRRETGSFTLDEGRHKMGAAASTRAVQRRTDMP